MIINSVRHVYCQGREPVRQLKIIRIEFVNINKAANVLERAYCRFHSITDGIIAADCIARYDLVPSCDLALLSDEESPSLCGLSCSARSVPICGHDLPPWPVT